MYRRNKEGQSKPILHQLQCSALNKGERQQDNGNTKQVRQYIGSVCIRVKEKENPTTEIERPRKGRFSFVLIPVKQADNIGR